MRRITDYIVVHCSATPPTMDIGAEEIRSWHTTKGWSDIGYHNVIKRDGTIEFGRDMNAIGAHVRGYNDKSIGVCMVGGVDKDMKPQSNFTDKQFLSLQILLGFYKREYPLAKIVGHRELNSGKACPSFDVKTFLRSKNMA